MSNRAHRLARSSGRDHGGDSERLADQIFQSTRVQAKVFVEDGEIEVTVPTLADWFIARDFLVNTLGLDRKLLRRKE